MQGKIGAILLALLLFVAASAAGTLAQPEQRVYQPFVASSVEAAQPAGIVFVQDVAMPFDVLNGVEPTMVQDRAGVWYISVFRINAGAQTGAWVVSWREGAPRAEPVARVGDWPIDDPIAGAVQPQSTYLSSGRGALALSYNRTKLLHFGWEGNARRPNLRVSQVTNFAP